MRKTLIPRPASSRKQRGVAIVFALGILGLLSVLALGFASTALLNNSISKNVMNDAYARTLARNLALAQALSVIKVKADAGFADYRKIYTYGSDATKDFLWKLDYSDADVQMFKYEPDQNSADKPRYNPANNVRWQYVKDSSGSKIIGRYAYVVIPNKGRLNPMMNIGRLASDVAKEPPATIQDPTFSNLSSSDDFKRQETLVSPGISNNHWRDAIKGPKRFRWMSFQELVKKVDSISDNDKKYLFQYKGIAPSITMRSPEAYWGTDGKLYSRFNLNRTDWDTLSPKTLCGASVASGTPPAEFPDEQTFIPWLKKMYDKDTTRNQALQIAANIIQYNRAEDKDTITNQNESGGENQDWLTTQPEYAGIGRHPMLNELGFLIRVRAEVAAVEEGEATETQRTFKYTPTFYITLDAGAELVYPFGPAKAAEMQDSEITFPGKPYNSYPHQLVRFVLRKFLKGSDLQSKINSLTNKGTLIIDGVLNSQMIHTDIDRIVVQTTGEVNKMIDSSTVITQMSEEGFGWTNFNLSLSSGDWNESPAYTLAGKFWKEGKTGKQQTLKIPIRSFSATTNRTLGDDGNISSAIARRMTIEWEALTPGSAAVLKYGGKQRDVAQLKDFTTPPTMTDMATEKVWFISYEATDPLVNYDKSTWKLTPSGLKEWNEASSLTNDYPGSLYNSGVEFDSVNPGVTGHTNKTVTAITDSGIKNIWTSYGWTTGKDPIAYRSDYQTPMGIIRHGPMCSFWELGCISRGEAWKTLNLLKKDKSATPDFSYAKGDAILFDQLKFTDENYSVGKINLNTDVHQVLEKIFNATLIGYKTSLNTSVEDDLLKIGTADDSNVEIIAETLNDDGAVAHTDSESSPCLACRLKKATANYYLQNRGDLFLSQGDLPAITGATKPALSDWTALQESLTAGNTYLEQIQIASKLMPILRADPIDTLRVVILAQSIKDMGGNVPVMVDWDGSGMEEAISDTAKAMYNAGYRRTVDGAAIFDTEPTLAKAITSNTLGTYDLGADKITGEARLIATLVRDPETGKWKLIRVQNVE